MVSILWCSLEGSIFPGRKYDSPDLSLSCYFTDLKRVTFTEEGGTAATLEVEVRTFNPNENENPEEVSGWVYLKIEVLP